jgi:hypothetical protein
LTGYLQLGITVALLVGLQPLYSKVMAETSGLGWHAELYGGRYYDDSRAGAYLALSKDLNEKGTFIGEALLERYPDYRFGGIGAHYLWPVGAIGDIGFVASQAWETYEFFPGIGTDYQTQIVGVEWELETSHLAIAAQAGTYLKDYNDEKPEYFSADAYYWGAQYDWYVRGATRWASGSSLNLLEFYRSFFAKGHLVTAYAGVGTDDLSLASPGNKDSIYAGAYTEILSNSDSVLTLWFEAAAEDNETLLTIELNLSFGTGARTPYITAFGFSLDN